MSKEDKKNDGVILCNSTEVDELLLQSKHKKYNILIYSVLAVLSCILSILMNHNFPTEELNVAYSSYYEKVADLTKIIILKVIEGTFGFCSLFSLFHILKDFLESLKIELNIKTISNDEECLEELTYHEALGGFTFNPELFEQVLKGYDDVILTKSKLN